MEMMDEKSLADGCMRGESWAHKRVYEQYAPVMMSVCMRYVGNDRETARDLLQDGFVKVFSRMEDWAGTGPLGGWIRRIFVTTALAYLRADNRLALNRDTMLLCDEWPDSADHSILDKLSADDLLACIARLPAGYRAVFNLHAIEGYSYSEVATMLGIAESTARTQFSRARNALQKSVYLLLNE